MVARTKRTSRRREHTDNTDCVIPPKLPHEALPLVMLKGDEGETAEIRGYVESQLKGAQVTHAEKLAVEYCGGQKYEAWDVHTSDGRWWAISPLTNVYPQELFPSLDYVITVHIGLTTRVMSRREADVPKAEKESLPMQWRRWEQAAQALDQADEPEEFQAVGMRCREALVAMVKTMARSEMVPAGSETPKAGNVIQWCELIADHLAKGSAGEHDRKYLKAVSRAGWQLLQDLTHSSSATRARGSLAVIVTQHILTVFGTIFFQRQLQTIPDTCPNCGSYQIGIRRRTKRRSSEAVPACMVCGWITPKPKKANASR